MKNDVNNYLGNDSAMSGKVNKQIEAYSTLFMIENLLRVSMHAVMEESAGINYFAETTFPPYERKFGDKEKGEAINVVERASELKKREKAYNLNMGYDYLPFWYLEYSMLIELIQNFWDEYFHLMFEGSGTKKNSVVAKLQEISSVRHAVAHNRYLSNIDLEKLRVVFRMLATSLDKKFLNNFNSLVLNSFEDNINIVSAVHGQVANLIARNKLVSSEILVVLNRAMSAVVTQSGKHQLSKKIDLVKKLLAGYNQLPRKPGEGKAIEQYVKSRNLVKELSDLVKSLGGDV